MFYISETTPEKVMNFADFLQYNCMCTQPIAKQNHVFQKILVKKFPILETNHEKMSVVSIFSPYLHNQLPK